MSSWRISSWLELKRYGACFSELFVFRLGVGDTVAGQVREDFWKLLPVEQRSDTLLYNWAIGHCDRNSQVVRTFTFVA